MELPLTGAEPVDELLEAFPRASRWLGDRGVICTQCGEVFWGSLSDLANYRKIEGEEFTKLLAELNEFLAQTDAE
ncbi:hypothetical protein JW859_02820 [bacterium]|nr:hypothetical protein [bacterium]